MQTHHQGLGPVSRAKIDPFSEVINILNPTVANPRVIDAAGEWCLRVAGSREPFYCIALKGACTISGSQFDEIRLLAGDAAVIASESEFVVTSLDLSNATEVGSIDVHDAPVKINLGQKKGNNDVRILLGHLQCDFHESLLLGAVMPGSIHMQASHRQPELASMIAAEAMEYKLGREAIFKQLLRAMFVDALRWSARNFAAPNVLRGLADKRIAAVIHLIHANPARLWKNEELASVAFLSLPGFCARFKRTVGVSPRSYVISWHMVVAKDMLKRQGASVSEVAKALGYHSPNAFSIAFYRHEGVRPARYAKDHLALRMQSITA